MTKFKGHIKQEKPSKENENEGPERFEGKRGN